MNFQQSRYMPPKILDLQAAQVLGACPGLTSLRLRCSCAEAPRPLLQAIDRLQLEARAVLGRLACKLLYGHVVVVFSGLCSAKMLLNVTKRMPNFEIVDRHILKMLAELEHVMIQFSKVRMLRIVAEKIMFFPKMLILEFVARSFHLSLQRPDSLYM